MPVSAPDERRDLARGGVLSFLGAAASAVLGLGITIILGRVLGDAGAGTVLQAMSVFAIALAFAKFGMDSTSIWLLPRQQIDHPSSLRRTVTVMLGIVIITSLIITGAVQGLTLLLWEDDPAVRSAVQGTTWFITAAALFLTAAAALRAVGRLRAYVLLANFGLPGLRLPAVWLAAGLSGSLTVVAVAWAAPALIVLLLALVALWAALPPSDQERPKLTGRILRFAWPRTLSSGLDQAIIWLDVLLVGLLAGPAAAGIYGGASRFIQVGLMVDAALRVVVSPRFSALLHQDRKEELQALYRLAATWLVMLASPLYLALAIFAPVVLSLLGPDFVEGSSTLMILSAGAIVTFLAGNIHSVLLMSGRSGWAAFNKAVVVSLNIIGNLLLVPVMGINGAAVTWVICMIIDALLALVQVQHFTGLQINPGQALVPLALSVVLMGGICLGARLWLGPTAPGLIVGCTVGGVAYLAGCVWLRRRLHLDGLVATLRHRRSEAG